MIRFKENFVVAKKVLAQVNKKIGKEVAKNCTVEAYANGREQGFSIVQDSVPQKGKWEPQRVCFSENRNSDDIVVYAGKTNGFDISSNIPGEEIYKQRVFFGPKEIDKTAQFIVDFFTKKEE